VLAGQIAGLRTRLVLTQNRDDLLFREPLLFICPSFVKGRTRIEWLDDLFENKARISIGRFPW
jgi:hypothetical protein